MPTEERSNGAAAIPGADHSQGSSAGTSSQNGDQTTTAKVNWQDDPEYRRQQSAKDAYIANLEREVAATKTREREQKLAGMDKYEREKFLREEAEAETVRVKRDAEYQEKLKQYESDIKEIADEYGVPERVIRRARSYDDAVELAKDWKADHPSSASQQLKQGKSETAPARRNHGDMGSGGARGEVEVRMERAVKSNDMTAFMRVQRERSKSQ